jgi:YHS domain-containing protein
MKSITIILLIFSGFFAACYTQNDKTGVVEQVHQASMAQPTENQKVTEYDPQPPFQAGSEKNTEKEIVDKMRTMYDAGINGKREAAHMQPKPTSHKYHQKTLPDPVVFANTVDFICDMKVMPSYTDTCHYKNRVYAFCSAYCRDKFKETPEKYLSKQ